MTTKLDPPVETACGWYWMLVVHVLTWNGAPLGVPSGAYRRAKTRSSSTQTWN